MTITKLKDDSEFMTPVFYFIDYSFKRKRCIQKITKGNAYFIIKDLKRKGIGLYTSSAHGCYSPT